MKTKEERFELYRRVFNHFGVKFQATMLIEECVELNAELCEWNPDNEKITEEMADVLICIDEFYYSIGVSKGESAINHFFRGIMLYDADKKSLSKELSKLRIKLMNLAKLMCKLNRNSIVSDFDVHFVEKSRDVLLGLIALFILFGLNKEALKSIIDKKLERLSDNIKNDDNIRNSGIALISKERFDQLYRHGYTTSSDSFNNAEGQLIVAAMTIIKKEVHSINFEIPPLGWNEDAWSKLVSKPHKERLVIAGALLAAEIDRISEL